MLCVSLDACNAAPLEGVTNGALTAPAIIHRARSRRRAVLSLSKHFVHPIGIEHACSGAPPSPFMQLSCGFQPAVVKNTI